MITENLSTLKIHKMSREQYERELAAGRIDEHALYITPDEELDLSGYATKEGLAETAAATLASAKEYTDAKDTAMDARVAAIEAKPAMGLTAEQIAEHDRAVGVADTAVQTVAAGTGLKAERTANAVTVSLDQAVTFVFDCGTSVL